MDQYVIVPTYNEIDNLRPLTEQIMELPVEIGVIVVDDNSPDGTGDLADELAATYDDRMHIIHRAGKLGLGTAYIAGFKWALTTEARYIMTMDADFSHHPRYIPDILEKTDKGCDLAIGSRYVAGGGTEQCTLPRRVLSHGANLFARTMLGLQARDATAGFRCYRRHVLETIPIDEIKSNGYSFLIEMLFYTQRSGAHVGEVPIIFENRQAGHSKISREEIYKALWTVVRLFGLRVTGRA
jgi:dolichol-phosphate mannosyltransferase